MEELIRSLVGTEVDINCGGTAVFRCKVVEVGGGIVKLLSDETGEVFIALDKVSAVCKVQGEHHRPGFVS